MKKQRQLLFLLAIAKIFLALDVYYSTRSPRFYKTRMAGQNI